MVNGIQQRCEYDMDQRETEQCTKTGILYSAFWLLLFFLSSPYSGAARGGAQVEVVTDAGEFRSIIHFAASERGMYRIR